MFTNLIRLAKIVFPLYLGKKRFKLSIEGKGIGRANQIRLFGSLGRFRIMTIVGKRKNAPVREFTQIRNLIRIEYHGDETFALVKEGENVASWVKVKKQEKGIIIPKGN